MGVSEVKERGSECVEDIGGVDVLGGFTWIAYESYI